MMQFLAPSLSREAKCTNNRLIESRREVDAEKFDATSSVSGSACGMLNSATLRTSATNDPRAGRASLCHVISKSAATQICGPYTNHLR